MPSLALAPQIHFRADSPIDLKVLLFIPSFHTEKYGGGHMAPGVSLYSRKVQKCPALPMPCWFLFRRLSIPFLASFG